MRSVANEFDIVCCEQGASTQLSKREQNENKTTLQMCSCKFTYMRAYGRGFIIMSKKCMYIS